MCPPPPLNFPYILVCVCVVASMNLNVAFHAPLVDIQVHGPPPDLEAYRILQVLP